MKLNKVSSKKAAKIILALLFLLFLCGCGIPNKADKERAGLFVNFEVIWRDPDDWNIKVLVDRNTGVLYYQVWTSYRYGITPILKADGKPLLYSDFRGD